jgi:putative endonuclease
MARMSRLRRCGTGGRITDGFIPSEAREPYSSDTAEDSVRMFYVYILASLSGTLYVGLTDDLRRRVEKHRLGLVDSFTKRYGVNRLMYFERFHDAEAARNRERQVKKYRRAKKIALFANTNPRWEDLSKQLTVSYKEVLM